VELVELSLEVEVLDDELAVELLDAEVVLLALEESALCSAVSRVCRSLLSFEIALGSGGGGGAALDVLLAELTEEADVALELEAESAAWLAEARMSRSSCHWSAPLEEPPKLPTDMA
jgi:hypothetical protein